MFVNECTYTKKNMTEALKFYYDSWIMRMTWIISAVHFLGSIFFYEQERYDEFYAFLFFSVMLPIFGIYSLYSRLIIKYKQLKMLNHVEVTVQTVFFDDWFELCTLENGGRVNYSYRNITKIKETEHLYIIEIRHGMLLILDRNRFSEGSADEFRTFIKKHMQIETERRRQNDVKISDRKSVPTEFLNTENEKSTALFVNYFIYKKEYVKEVSGAWRKRWEMKCFGVLGIVSFLMIPWAWSNGIKINVLECLLMGIFIGAVWWYAPYLIELNFYTRFRKSGRLSAGIKVTFYETGYEVLDFNDGSKIRCTYKDIVKVVETRHLFILVLKYEKLIILDKGCFKKGNNEEFGEFIQKKRRSDGVNYTYILECSDGSLYTGWTNDMEKRLKAHNEGKGAKYTRGRGPVKLVHVEEFDTKEDAMSREYAIKQMTREEKKCLIEGNNKEN